MRLDLYLKLSRIIPRRTFAKELCDSGAILINGRPAKASHEVSPGETLTVELPAAVRIYRVEAVPTGKNVSREGARELSTLLDTQRKELLD